VILEIHVDTLLSLKTVSSFSFVKSVEAWLDILDINFTMHSSIHDWWCNVCLDTSCFLFEFYYRLRCV